MSINDFWKNIWAPKSIIGIDISGKYINIVNILNLGKTIKLKQIASEEIKKTDQLSDQISSIFQRHGINHEMVVSCISSSCCFIRELSFPFENIKKIQKVIKYQLEPYVPVPVEDLIVDFLSLNGTSPLLVAGVPKDILAQHISLFSEIGFEPHIISIDIVALIFLYLYTNSIASQKIDGPVAIIYFTSEHTSVIINKYEVDFIRVLPGRIHDIQDIIDTFKLYKLKKNESHIKKVLLTGYLSDQEELKSELEKELNIEVSEWRPFDTISSEKDIQTDKQTRLSVALGLAICPLYYGKKLLNLRKEEFLYKKENINTKQILTIGIYALLILALIGVDLHYRVSAQEQLYNNLRKEIQLIFRRTFPEVRTIIKGKELFQMEQKMSEEMSKYQWINNITSKPYCLDVLKNLSMSIPSSLNIKVENLLIDGNKVELEGYASSFEAVDELEKSLKRNNIFKTIKLVNAKTNKREKGIRFDFTIQLRKEMK